jgi:hypothetical protein
MTSDIADAPDTTYTPMTPASTQSTEAAAAVVEARVPCFVVASTVIGTCLAVMMLVAGVYGVVISFFVQSGNMAPASVSSFLLASNIFVVLAAASWAYPLFMMYYLWRPRAANPESCHLQGSCVVAMCVFVVTVIIGSVALSTLWPLLPKVGSEAAIHPAVLAALAAEVGTCFLSCCAIVVYPIVFCVHEAFF